MTNPEKIRVELPPQTQMGALDGHVYALTPIELLAQEGGKYYVLADAPAIAKRSPLAIGVSFITGVALGVGAAYGLMSRVNDMNNDLQAAHKAAVPSASAWKPSTTPLPTLTPTPEQSPSDSPTPSVSPVAAKKQIIFLDPGHSGKNIDQTDAATGLRDVDANITLETAENYTVAVLTKDILAANGFTVVMSKDNLNDVKTSRERSDEAIAANADVAVSINNDHSMSTSSQAVYPQKVGQYRQPYADAGEDMPKVEVTNAQVSCVSQAYADIIKSNRITAQGKNVVVAEASFSDAVNKQKGFSKGNIYLAPLFTADRIPWIYNKMGAKVGTSKTTKLSDADMQRYAQGIANGIKAAMEQQAAINAKCGK